MQSAAPPQAASITWWTSISISIFSFIPRMAPRRASTSTTASWKIFRAPDVELKLPVWMKFRQVWPIQGGQLSEESAGDLAFLTQHIHARLLELQSIQMWRKDPDHYISDLSYGVFLMMKRNFAPPRSGCSR